MRILYHHRTQAEDGQAVHIRSLIGAFRALGHEVREVSLVARSEERRAARSRIPRSSSGRRFRWVEHLPPFAHELLEHGYGVMARGALARAVREFGPDFVYERYAFGNSAGVRAAASAGRPLVLEVNSPLVLELERTRGLAFPGLARRAERRILGSAAVVCAVSGVLREMLVELGVERERVLVTHNGVDLERYAFPDRAAARRAARAALGLAPEPAPGELVLGFVGYFRAWHRLDVVLGALGAPALASARLVLVGDGPARAELERLGRERALGARLLFAGVRPHGEIPALLPAFDMALVPAINPYASPLKLFEYLAASLAVVAPDQDNLREVLGGDEALLVPPGDVDAMRAALESLAGDPELRARLGQRGRAAIERADLTWKGNARRVVAAVEGLR